jgi:hypothetical protein
MSQPILVAAILVTMERDLLQVSSPSGLLAQFARRKIAPSDRVD